MTAALTPELAIAYVRELSADVRAVVILGSGGELLAGPERLAQSACAFLAAAGTVEDVAARTPRGVVIAARTAANAVVVSAGPLSLVGPTALDARAAAEGLLEAAEAKSAVQSQTSGIDAKALRLAAETVISATDQGN